MATKNLATVPGAELSENVNFIAEVGGDINRVPYSLIENQIKAVNESIDGLNELLGSHGTELAKLQSQFIYADTIEDLKFSTSNIGNNKTCTCFLSANCVQELTSNYSVAAKGYVSKPSDSMIDISLMIGDQTLLFGRYDTSLSLFSFKETVNKGEYLELSNTLTTLQGIVDGHTTDINTATQNIQTNAENIQANTEAIAENTTSITQLNSNMKIPVSGTLTFNPSYFTNNGTLIEKIGTTVNIRVRGTLKFDAMVSYADNEIIYIPEGFRPQFTIVEYRILGKNITDLLMITNTSIRINKQLSSGDKDVEFSITYSTIE